MPYLYNHAFSTGEVSPILSARDDKPEWYNKSCRTLENFMVIPQGPIIRRPGTEFIYSLSSLFSYPISVRMIPFIFSETQSYALLIVSDSTLNNNTQVLFVYEDGLLTDPDAPSQPLMVSMNAPVDGASFDYAQSYDYLVMVHPQLVPSKLVRVAHDNWTFGPIAFDSLVLTDSSYYPTVVIFHNQRLVFAGALREPATVRMSKAGDIFNFSAPASPALDDDRVVFTLASGKQNSIVWLLSTDSLLLGTLGDEWQVTGTDGGPITPTSILAKKQTGKGSTRRKPLVTGNASIILERHGKILDALYYSLTDNGLQTSDLRILAEHLTRDTTVTDWTYQQAPSSIIWITTDEGCLLGFTYEKEHKINAWHRHPIDGKVKALTAIPGSDNDRLWLTIEREIAGQPLVFLERMDAIRVPSTTTDVIHLDSYSRYSGVPISVIHNLEHLIGRSVSILVDGAQHPDRSVSAQGQLTLDYPGSEVYIGLSYSSVCEPLLENVAMSDGGSKGRTARLVSGDILILNSLLFEFGTDEIDMNLEPFRYATDITGVVEPLFSGIKQVLWSGDYDIEPRLILRQTMPFPFTVLGIVLKAEVFN